MKAQVNNFDWPEKIKKEFDENKFNGVVGSKLVSESSRVRVWHINLSPGDRMPFHRHALDYFWTAMTTGKSVSHQNDGSTVEHEYQVGETFHASFLKDEFMYHDLENIGDTDLVFTTVEFLDSPNTPLAIDGKYRNAD